LAVSVLRVLDLERNVLHAVSVRVRVPRDLVVGTERARDDEPRVSLLQDVGGTIPDARLGTRIRDRLEAERALIVIGRLLRVADPELDVVPPEQRHEVLAHASDSRASR
jgi:hypothetical protein